MMLARLVVVLALFAWCDAGISLSRYHATDALYNQITALAPACPALTITKRTDRRELTAVSIKQAGSVTNRFRVLLFFGEHPRELISPETALRFIQTLCGATPASDAAATLTRVATILARTEILMYPIANAAQHRRVVNGAYCQRTNGRNVDLNRNWSKSFARSGAGTDAYSGPSAFSEWETQLLRDAAKAFHPQLFISVHAGFLGMYTPWAASTPPSGPDDAIQRASMTILRDLNPTYCNCDVGPVSARIPYQSPGTCLDWMRAEGGATWSFAVEIFGGIIGKTYRNAALPADAHTNFMALSNAAHAASDVKVLSARERRIQRRIEAENVGTLVEDADETVDDASETRFSAQHAFPIPKQAGLTTCLKTFNPTTDADYDAAVDNWSRALIHLIWSVVTSPP